MEADQHVVVLYGSSLFMACVEASLKSKPGLKVVQIDANGPDAKQRLKMLVPDAIIFDLDTPAAQFAIRFLKERPDLTVIGLGLTTNKVTVLSSQQYAALTADNLAHLIQTQGRSSDGGY